MPQLDLHCTAQREQHLALGEQLGSTGVSIIVLLENLANGHLKVILRDVLPPLS